MAEPAPQQTFEERGLAFFGRIAAAVSHDFNNVLTIIDQVAGLLGDMADMAGSGQPLNPDQLKQQADRLAAQVQRGVAMSKDLNRFAHSVDQARTAVDLLALAKNIAALMQPIARRRRATIEVDPASPAARVLSQPFVLGSVLAAVIEAGLPEGEAGGTIAIAVQEEAGQAGLLVSAAGFRYDLDQSEHAERAASIGVRLIRGEPGGSLASWAIQLPGAD